MDDLRLVYHRPDPRIAMVERLRGPWGTYVHTTDDGFPFIASHPAGRKPNLLVRAYLRWRTRGL